MARECSIARALALIGEKWSLLAIREVLLGSFKFDEIQHNTGAPRDVLSDRLRKLVDSGVLQRVPYITRQEVEAVLEVVKSPKGVQAKPEIFYDNSFLQKLEASGFINSLYPR